MDCSLRDHPVSEGIRLELFIFDTPIYSVYNQIAETTTEWKRIAVLPFFLCTAVALTIQTIACTLLDLVASLLHCNSASTTALIASKIVIRPLVLSMILIVSTVALPALMICGLIAPKLVFNTTYSLFLYERLSQLFGKPSW